MGAKTITIHTLLTPTGVGAALQAGGSLVVGTTYYYTVVALQSIISGSPIHISIESVLSSEVSATPTAGNQTIQVSWTASANATHYAVLRTETSGDYSFGNCEAIIDGTVLPTVSPLTDTGALTERTFEVITGGAITVDLDGGSDGDRIDEEWIYDQLNSAGHVPTFCEREDSESGEHITYTFKHCSIIAGLDSANVCYLKFTDMVTITVIGVFNLQAYTDFIWGEKVGTGDAALGKDGGTLAVLTKGYQSTQNFIMGTFNLYGITLRDMGSHFDVSGGYSYYKTRAAGYRFSGNNTSEIINSYINGLSGNAVFLYNILVKDCILNCGLRQEGSLTSAGNPQFVDCVIASTSTGAIPYCYSLMYAKVTFTNMYYAMVQRYHGTTNRKIFNLYNCIWKGDTTYIQGINNPSYTKYIDTFSLDVTIVDTDGNSIQGAGVYIEEETNSYNACWEDTGETLGAYINTTQETNISVSDASVFSVGDVILVEWEKMEITAVDSVNDKIEVVNKRGQEETWDERQHITGAKVYRRLGYATTDADGQIETQLLKVNEYLYNASNSPKYDKTSYTFKITVSKSGYETLTIPNITIDKKIDWVIVLKPKVRFDLEGTAYAMIGDKHVMELC